MEEIISFGNNPFFRFFLGWALPPHISLLKYTETETTKRLRENFHIVQDILMPISNLENALKYLHEHLRIYPLWLCPMQIFENDRKIGFLHPH